jgi:hypothetical protein
LGDGFVGVRLRYEFLRYQIAGAINHALAVLQVRGRFVDAGTHLAVVEFEQGLAGGDVAAFGEMDLHDPAGNFRPHDHRLVGTQAAHGFEPGRKRLHLDLGGLDGHRRHAAGRATGRTRAGRAGRTAGSQHQGSERG